MSNHHHTVSAREHRPWGFFEVLSESETGHKVKRITVMPGQRLSLQRHQHRREHWFFVTGHAEVTLDEDLLVMSAGQAIDIAQGQWHRARNHGDSPLVFIEVQTGSYFGEDDIERRDDDYGRAPSSAGGPHRELTAAAQR